MSGLVRLDYHLALLPFSSGAATHLLHELEATLVGSEIGERQHVVSHDYVRFFEEQMPIRRQFCYPPYYRLIMIKLRQADYEKLNKAAEFLAKRLRPVFKNNLLGPEYPVVSRVKNQYIKQILIKFDRNDNSNKIKEIIKSELESFKRSNDYKSVNVSIDIDPI